MLNNDKTEFWLVRARKQLAKVSIDGVRVGDYNVSPCPSVRSFGVWLDPHLSMNVNIIRSRKSAFFLS